MPRADVTIGFTTSSEDVICEIDSADQLLQLWAYSVCNEKWIVGGYKKLEKNGEINLPIDETTLPVVLLMPEVSFEKALERINGLLPEKEYVLSERTDKGMINYYRVKGNEYAKIPHNVFHKNPLYLQLTSYLHLPTPMAIVFLYGKKDNKDMLLECEKNPSMI